MEDRILHSVALRFATWLNYYAKKEGKDYLRLVYSSEAFVINVTKLATIFLVSFFLGTFKLTVASLIGFNLIRKKAFGLHASNTTSCGLQMILLFVVIPFFTSHIVISNVTVFVIYAILFFLLFLYAPADTKSRPLVGKKVREKLKLKAMKMCVVTLIIALLINNPPVKLCITLGSIYAVIFVLPLTYILFRKSRNNYKAFEVEKSAV